MSRVRDVVAVLGLPGSGKTTQARILAAELGGVALSAGDWMRALAAGGDPEAGETVHSGRPIPPDRYRAFLAEALAGPDDVLVLDGSPRDEWHVGVLAAATAGSPVRVSGVLLDLPADRAAARIGGRGSRRPDDAEDVVARRIALQSAALGRLAESFRRRWPLAVLDATATEEAVTDRVRRAVGARARRSPPGAGPPS